jgi:hypothetical protein
MTISNQGVIVLGMHRSGTSALTGVLSMLGADPGGTLIPAHESINPKGFWEHAEIVAIHERLLAALGSSWHDEGPLQSDWWRLPLILPFRTALMNIVRKDFTNRPLWILKDPRLCRLLPMWLDILREVECKPSFVIALRNPFDVAESLKYRNGFIEEKSHLLWLEHLLDAVRWSYGYPRVVVTYDSLLADWQVVAKLVSENLQLTWPVECSLATAEIEAFLEPSLCHHGKSKVTPDGNRLGELALAAYEIVIRTPSDQLGQALAGIRKEAQIISHLVSPWASCTNHVLQREQDLQAKNHNLECFNVGSLAEIERIKSSLSWQITKPVRLIQKLIRFMWVDGA